MPNPFEGKASPYFKGAKTSQQIADSRYGRHPTPNLRQGPLIADAQRDELPEEDFNGARSRQVSDLGKVRK